MTSPRTHKLGIIFLVAALLGIAIVLATKAAGFLIVDQPHPSDVILVLAGETDHRPQLPLSNS